MIICAKRAKRPLIEQSGKTTACVKKNMSAMLFGWKYFQVVKYKYKYVQDWIQVHQLWLNESCTNCLGCKHSVAFSVSLFGTSNGMHGA